MDRGFLDELAMLCGNGKRTEARERLAAATGLDPVTLLLAQALVAHYATQHEDAPRYTQEGEAVAVDAVGRAAASGQQPGTLVLLGRYEEAVSAADGVVAAARAAGNRLGEAVALHAGSVALGMLGRHVEALSTADAAVGAARAAGSARAESAALATRADGLRALGRYEESLSAAEAALAAARAADDTLAEAGALATCAEGLRVLERHEESLSAAEAAVAAARSRGGEEEEAHALLAGAKALRGLGRHEESLAAADEALRVVRAADFRAFEAAVLNSRALALWRLGRTGEALGSAQEATALATESADDWTAASAGAVAAMIAMASADDQATAIRCARAAREAAERSGNESAAAMAHAVLDRLGASAILGEVAARVRAREGELRAVLGADPVRPTLPQGATGLLLPLRRWASFTTVDLLRPEDGDGSPTGEWSAGGGYFLWWDGWGLVIDPGSGFGRNFRAAGFVPRNVNGVVATHHHIDHTGDMLDILTMLHRMNKAGEDGAPPAAPHSIQFAFAPGPSEVFGRTAEHLAGSCVQGPLGPAMQWRFANAGRDVAAVRTVTSEHRDLAGHCGVALRAELLAPDGTAVVRLGITSDTAYWPQLAAAMSDVDLLVVHVGGLYDEDLAWLDGAGTPPLGDHQHLGLAGTVQLLCDVKRKRSDGTLPPVLLSEWGEELGAVRQQITSTVQIEAFKRAGGSDLPVVWPAERGMRIALGPGLVKPLCECCYTEYACAPKQDADGTLHYYCAKCPPQPFQPEEGETRTRRQAPPVA